MTDQPTTPPDPAPDDVPADDDMLLEEVREVDPALEQHVGRKPSQDPDVPAGA